MSLRSTLPLLLAAPLAAAIGCTPCDRDAIDFTPYDDGAWPVSSPEEQGLDPELVTDLYCDAAQLEKVQSVLVIQRTATWWRKSTTTA